MKTAFQCLFSATIAAALLCSVTGCGKDEEVHEAMTAEIDSPPPATDDVHDHDHEHGPNGLPVVEADDGSQLEWDFNEDQSTFVMIPPAELTDSIESVVVKTVVEGNESTYEFTEQESPQGKVWAFASEELATAVLMGDAVERKLIVTTDSGELTAPVKHFDH